MFKVYVLMEPTGEVRYVGSTARKLSVRRAWHECSARRGVQTPVAVWTRSLLQRGQRPRIEHVAEVDSSAVAAAIEAAWIAFCRTQCYDLLNVCSRAYIPTLAHRRAISNAMRGRSASRWTRFRMRESQRLAWQSRRARSRQLENGV
jgi:hypothetical protein